MEAVQEMVKNLKSKKAPRFDEISVVPLKELPGKAVTMLTDTFNTRFSIEIYPRIF